MRKGKITNTKLKEEKGKGNPSKVKQRKNSNSEGNGAEGHVVKTTRKRNKIKRRKWKEEGRKLYWKQSRKTDMRQE